MNTARQLTLILGICCIFTACEQPITSREKGVLAGGAIGAGTGAIVGHSVGSTGAGIAIGGALGALSGGLVGNSLGNQESRQNEQDEKLRRQEEELRRQRREIEELRHQRGGDSNYDDRGRDSY